MLAFRLLKKAWAKPTTTHGSARWATLADLIEGDALGGRTGVIVAKAWWRFVRFKRDGATLVYAPMGKGKGVGIVIPNLLDYPGAAIINDPKGENYAVTRRKRAQFGPVYKLNAIDTRDSDLFNPLDMIRVGTDYEGVDAAQLADLLVAPEGEETHWDTAARQLITITLRYVLNEEPPELRTLAHVRELLTLSLESLKELLATMARSPHASVAQEARSMLDALETDEGPSVVRNAAKALVFWASDTVGGRLTMASTFSFMDVHARPASIYIMVPEDMLRVFRPFMRVMMGCALSALIRGKYYARPAHKPLLMIDECAALGRLELLEQGMGLLREYSHTVLIFQDVGQIRKRYGEDGARSIMSASGCQITFGVSDLDTARDIAEGVGRHTVLSRSEGVSEGNMDIVSAQLQRGRSETGRHLIDASEARRMGSRECIVFMQDQVSAPVRAKKVLYYNEKRRWGGQWDTWRAPTDPGVTPFPSAADPSAPASRAA